MISDRLGCIFVHIPKCGGTSLEDVIWPEPREETDLWMGFVDGYRNRYQTGGLRHEFLFDAARRIMVDFIGRFETLAADAEAIFDRLGLGGAALPHANKGARGPWRDYYGPAERRMVETLYAKDLDLLGYAF